MTTQTISIIVLGGGYSGVMAALRLAGKTKRLLLRNLAEMITYLNQAHDAAWE